MLFYKILGSENKKEECLINLQPNKFKLESMIVCRFRTEEVGRRIQVSVEEVGHHMYQET